MSHHPWRSTSSSPGQRYSIFKHQGFWQLSWDSIDSKVLLICNRSSICSANKLNLMVIHHWACVSLGSRRARWTDTLSQGVSSVIVFALLTYKYCGPRNLRVNMIHHRSESDTAGHKQEQPHWFELDLRKRLLVWRKKSSDTTKERDCITWRHRVRCMNHTVKCTEQMKHSAY